MEGGHKAVPAERDAACQQRQEKIQELQNTAEKNKAKVEKKDGQRSEIILQTNIEMVKKSVVSPLSLAASLGDRKDPWVYKKGARSTRLS